MTRSWSLASSALPGSHSGTSHAESRPGKSSSLPPRPTSVRVWPVVPVAPPEASILSPDQPAGDDAGSGLVRATSGSQGKHDEDEDLSLGRVIWLLSLKLAWAVLYWAALIAAVFLVNWWLESPPNHVQR